jgi:hypothetical protein
VGAPARTEGTGGSLFSVTGGTAGSRSTGDTESQIRPEAGTWLVRVSYEGVLACPRKWPLSSILGLFHRRHPLTSLTHNRPLRHFVAPGQAGFVPESPARKGLAVGWNGTLNRLQKSSPYPLSGSGSGPAGLRNPQPSTRMPSNWRLAQLLWPSGAARAQDDKPHRDANVKHLKDCRARRTNLQFDPFHVIFKNLNRLHLFKNSNCIEVMVCSHYGDGSFRSCAAASSLPCAAALERYWRALARSFVTPLPSR